MLSFLHHLLFPSHKNNFRAKILHNSSLVVIILLLVISSSGIFLVKRAAPSVLGISYSINESELLNDTNLARLQNNEPPLTLNQELSDAARKKAADMFAKDYWAHFAPDGTTPWSFIKAAGYDYSYAGENLAKGFTSSQDVVNAWMNSPSHRENLLSSKYKDIGFAVAEGTLQGEDTVLVVQMFGAPVGTSVDNSAPPSVPEKTNLPIIQKPVVIDSNGEYVAAVQSENKPVNNPIIDSQKTSKSLVTVFLAFIIIVLVLDIIVVEKRKIPRIVGHNMDHIILLAIFLLFIILTTNRGIL